MVLPLPLGPVMTLRPPSTKSSEISLRVNVAFLWRRNVAFLIVAGPTGYRVSGVVLLKYRSRRSIEIHPLTTLRERT